MRSLLALAVFLPACFNYESFQRQQIEATCSWADDCGFMGQDTIAECVDANDDDIEANSTCENFNSDKANSCLQEMSEVGCFDISDLMDLGVCAEVCSN